MPLESPRSSSGLATPRTFHEFVGDPDAFHELYCIDDFASEDDFFQDSSSSSDEGRQSSYDDTEFGVVTGLINVCSDCSKCEKKMARELSVLETKFAEESLVRHRQMQLMIDFEKRTREWLVEKNAEIERLQSEKRNAEIERLNFSNKVNILLTNLSVLQKAFDDVHRKYTGAIDTIKILGHNIEILKAHLDEREECISRKQEEFSCLKKHATERLEKANAQLDVIEKNFSSECSKLRADVNSSKTKVQELTEELEWKDHENAELLSICEFLLQNSKEPENNASDDFNMNQYKDAVE